MTERIEQNVYGIIAEFTHHEKLLEAARRMHSEGYSAMEGYTPHPVEGLREALGHPPNRIPLIMLAAGTFGALGGYFMQWYSAVIAYPINVGGRPLHSWPSFIPLTFELMVLCASLAGVGAMIFFNGMPEPYHPIFEAKNFERASQDRYFLCIESSDPSFDREKTKALLLSLEAEDVSEVLEE